MSRNKNAVEVGHVKIELQKLTVRRLLELLKEQRVTSDSTVLIMSGGQERPVQNLFIDHTKKTTVLW